MPLCVAFWEFQDFAAMPRRQFLLVTPHSLNQNQFLFKYYKHCKKKYTCRITTHGTALQRFALQLSNGLCVFLWNTFKEKLHQNLIIWICKYIYRKAQIIKFYCNFCFIALKNIIVSPLESCKANLSNAVPRVVMRLVYFFVQCL